MGGKARKARNLRAFVVEARHAAAGGLEERARALERLVPLGPTPRAAFEDPAPSAPPARDVSLPRVNK